MGMFIFLVCQRHRGCGDTHSYFSAFRRSGEVGASYLQPREIKGVYILSRFSVVNTHNIPLRAFPSSCGTPVK